MSNDVQTIINKVPHPVNILDEGNKLVRVFPKSNGMARLNQFTNIIGEIDGIPITSTVFGNAQGLPNPSEGTYFIVSNLVKTSLPHRKDLLTPSNIVRDKIGNIIGCRSLDN